MQISRHKSTSLLSQSSVGLKDIEHPSSLLPIRVQARCISSERHVKTFPSTSARSETAQVLISLGGSAGLQGQVPLPHRAL
jgi:hypothetical protein